MNVIIWEEKLVKLFPRGSWKKPVIFRTHGGRAGDMERGASKIDIAFFGGSLCGSYGKPQWESTDLPPADPLAMLFQTQCMQKKVVAVTDYLVPYPLRDVSIEEGYVDYVVQVPQIGRSCQDRFRNYKDHQGSGRPAGSRDWPAQVCEAFRIFNQWIFFPGPGQEELLWLWPNMWKR